MGPQLPPVAPLIPPPPAVRRQDRRKIGVVAIVLALGAGGVFLVKLNQQPDGGPLARSGQPIPEGAASGTMPSTSAELRLPSSYAQVSLLPPPAPPAPAPMPPPVQTTQVALKPQDTDNPFLGREPRPLVPPVPLTPPRDPPPLVARSSPQPAPKEPPKPPSKWLFADLKQQSGVQEPPFPVPKDEEIRGNPQASQRADSLFPQAVWGTPADPTKVLYRSQVINGLLQHDINSDQPGLMRILVTEEVQDRFGQGHTLLPQYTILLGTQDGKVSFGQSRLGISIDSAELPDGTVVAFIKAKVGDETGATGVTGKVNNHWAQVGIGAILTAALSVGSRSVAGSPSGFQPNLAQDFAKDVSGSVNQTGQQIVRRSLDVAPTITLKYGTPVTVQLSENVSFQTPGAIIRK
jgi:type IV secretion system protein TrbI